MTRRQVMVAVTSVLLAPAAFLALRALRDAPERREVEAPRGRAALGEHALPVTSRVPLAGDAVTLGTTGNEPVALATAGGAVVQYEEVVALRRTLASSRQGALTVNRSVFFVPTGTRATVIDEGVLLYEVRIDEGEHAGWRAFVERERVVKVGLSVGHDS